MATKWTLNVEKVHFNIILAFKGTLCQNTSLTQGEDTETLVAPHDKKSNFWKNSLENLLNKWMTATFNNQEQQTLGKVENLVPKISTL